MNTTAKNRQRNTPTYRVERLVSDNGECHVLVVNVSTGLPVFCPSVWLTAHRRVKGIAAGTLANNAQTIATMYCWADDRGLDLEGRFSRGEFLSQAEREDIVEWLRIEVRSQPRGRNVLRFRPAEPAREPKLVSTVTSEVGNYRLDVAADYLYWLATVACDRLLNSGLKEASERAQALRDRMTDDLRRFKQRAKGRNALGQRMAPEAEVIHRLLEVVKLDHPENPWADPPRWLHALTAAEKAGDHSETKRIRQILGGKLAIRLRNRLIIHLLYHMGLRRGELLGLYASDLVGAKLFVLRRPDNSLDPRPQKPNTKTRDRELRANSGLQVMWLDYVSLARQKFRGARKRPFLVVNHVDGEPLTFSGLAMIFKDLRSVKGLPKNLTPHHLRHAWNEEFSRLADEQGLDPAREVQIRAELMGWNPGAPEPTAEKYLRRHNKQRAQEIHQQMQEDMMHPRDDDHVYRPR